MFLVPAQEFLLLPAECYFPRFPGYSVLVLCIESVYNVVAYLTVIATRTAKLALYHPGNGVIEQRLHRKD